MTLTLINTFVTFVSIGLAFYQIKKEKGIPVPADTPQSLLIKISICSFSFTFEFVKTK